MNLMEDYKRRIYKATMHNITYHQSKLTGTKVTFVLCKSILPDKAKKAAIDGYGAKAWLIIWTEN